MMCVQPAARYSSMRAMHSSGVPAIAHTFFRTSSVTALAAALRPPRSSDVDARNAARRMCIVAQRRHGSREYSALVLECSSCEHTAHDVDAFAHHGCRTDLFPFALANLLHKNLRRSKP